MPFTYQDIERYHQGLMSAAEMHALEKAALDDAFLSEALDGYAYLGGAASGDMSDLQSRLQRRISEEQEEATVVPIAMHPSKKQFPWWRVAAAVLLIGGLGMLIYQFSQPAKKAEIAQSKDNDRNATSKDTLISQKEKTVAKEAELIFQDSIKPLTPQQNKQSAREIKELPAVPAQAEEIATIAPVASAIEEEARKKAEIQNDIAANNRRQASIADRYQADAAANSRSFYEQQKSGPNRNLTYRSPEPRYDSSAAAYINRYNIFRGQVVDLKNNALPFANITNTRDQVGTYTDARGYFTLISTDTVLDVNVRSIGFVNDQYRLNAHSAGNTVQLQEDNSLNTKILDTSFRMLNLARLNNMNVEEPAPVDGWQLYETYVLNNLKVPDAIKPPVTKTQVVELSFQVDKLGQPINIKVVRSDCKACEPEAIRLVKEGPKWKYTRKSKTTKVAFSF